MSVPELEVPACRCAFVDWRGVVDPILFCLCGDRTKFFRPAIYNYPFRDDYWKRNDGSESVVAGVYRRFIIETIRIALLVKRRGAPQKNITPFGQPRFIFVAFTYAQFHAGDGNYLSTGHDDRSNFIWYASYYGYFISDCRYAVRLYLRVSCIVFHLVFWEQNLV